MKRSLLISVSLFTVLVLLADVACAGQGGHRGRRGRQGSQAMPRQRAETAESGGQGQSQNGYGYGRQQSQGERGSSNATDGTLSTAEIKILSGMREEEKLARDVYRSLAKTSDLRVFSNIATAESRHMQALARVSTRYNAESPVVTSAPGRFTDPKFQKLYESLVAAGAQSSLDALMVGAKIEEMDIVDLRRAVAGTRHADVRAVYDNLERGSRNHLRAFASQIASLGGTYHAGFLTQAEFDKIADSPTERGGQGSQSGVARKQGGGGKGGRSSGGGRGVDGKRGPR